MSGDETGFWQRQNALRALLPYFLDWRALARPMLPRSMAGELNSAVTQVATAMAAASATPIVDVARRDRLPVDTVAIPVGGARR